MCFALSQSSKTFVIRSFFFEKWLLTHIFGGSRVQKTSCKQACIGFLTFWPWYHINFSWSFAQYDLWSHTEVPCLVSIFVFPDYFWIFVTRHIFASPFLLFFPEAKSLTHHSTAPYNCQCVKSLTHLYLRKWCKTHGSFPTSSIHVHAYTSTTGQWKKYVPAAASGIARHHIHTARLYMSNNVSPPAPKIPFIVTSLTARPII